MRRILIIFTFVALMLSLFPAGAGAANPPDYDVAGGHFFSQTGGGGGKGYTVTDDNGVRFWSEFKRLGGVNAVGYPASRRFQWDGYTVQVFQRVIFQWHPESNSVAFVNVFDRLHDLGKDDWLLTVRQTPKPAQLNEQGMSWNQIVANRLKLLDAQPAIKTKYYAVVGDPIQVNGLPTSAITDLGNAYVLRAQRVVFQLWKQDVPWAKAGTVTVALGGDIAKEAGILPDPEALVPGTVDELTKGAPSVNWAVYRDPDRTFKYPAGWKGPGTLQAGSFTLHVLAAPDQTAAIVWEDPFTVGSNYDHHIFEVRLLQIQNGLGYGIAGNQFTVAQGTVGGYPSSLIGYATTGNNPTMNIALAIWRGNRVHHFEVFATAPRWDADEDTLLDVLGSYQTLR